MKTALITGATGQDGSYLANLLINNGYTVYCTTREGQNTSTWRLDFLGITSKIKFINLDLLDTDSVEFAIKTYKFDEVYNLAAQSNVKKSFDNPEYTANVNYLGVIRLLESIKNHSPNTRFFQASTAEIFGDNDSNLPLTEDSIKKPKNPYGTSKLAAFLSVKNYREAYGIKASSGILFAHESPLRGPDFVTKKITSHLTQVKLGKMDKLILGNINSQRDWGYAPDYVEAFHLMLQNDTPDDYIISTGKAYSVRQFIEYTAQALNFEIKWEGVEEKEIGIDKSTGKVVVSISPEFYRPVDAKLFVGNNSKAQKNLSWKPKTNLRDIIKKMVEFEINKN